MLATCSSLRFRFGIFDPGLTPGGFLIHILRFASLFSRIPLAMVVREPTWVRFGPMTAAAVVPLIAWQATQPAPWKAWNPAWAVAASVSAGVFWASTHLAKFS